MLFLGREVLALVQARRFQLHVDQDQMIGVNVLLLDDVLLRVVRDRVDADHLGVVFVPEDDVLGELAVEDFRQR